MKRLVVCFIALLFPSSTPAQDREPARVLVKFRAGSRLLEDAHRAARSGRPGPSSAPRPLAEGSAAAAALAPARVVALAALKHDASLQPLAGGVERIFVASIEPGASVSDAVRALAALADVEYAELDAEARGNGAAAEERGWTRVGLVPNDSGFSSGSGQWSLRNTGQTVQGVAGKSGADINTVPAWDITTGSSSVTVAFLDTGIAAAAADFSGRLLEGFDYVNNKTDAADDHGHGTAVASIAAATGNNSVGIAGVNWSCKILPVKVLDRNNTGNSSNVASGLIFAADKGARVINVSLSITENVSALRDAVDDAASKGAVVVAGMGNTNSDTTSFPAGYANVIAVGATNNRDQRITSLCGATGGSNFGAHIDFVAPGDFMRALDFANPSATLLFCGTSVATPLVSGTASLLLALNPNLTATQIYDALKAGAQDQVGGAAEDTPGWDKFYGWGRIDAYKALVASGATNVLTSTLYFPRLVTTASSSTTGDNSENTGIAVANLGTTDATLLARAFDRSGAVISGADIINPRALALKVGEQIPVIDSQVFGSGLPAKKPVGWFQLESSSAKTVGFFLMFNDSLTVLDGADVSSATMTSFVLPEVEDLGFTQVHAANPSSSAANLTIELLRSDGTARVAAVARAAPGNGSLAETFTQLFPGVTPTASDYLRVTSDRAVAAFEFLGKSGEYAEGLNAQNAAQGATVLYSPQYVIGGAFRTTLSIVNLDSTAGSVTLELIGDNGAAIGPAIGRQIAARGKLYISDQSFFVAPGSGTTQGYVKITSSGPRLAGSVVFGDPARNTFSSSLPLVSTLLTSFVYSQLASNETFFTGIAILNPGDADATVTVEVFDAKGVRVVATVESIPARGRKSQLLTQYFPALIGQSRSSGYIKVTSDRAVASFALFGTNDLSVLSAVPPQVVP